MNERFGPWSSALGDGLAPHLSTFWKRRLARLASTRTARVGVSRREWLKLSAAGAAACALPTVHLASADGNNDNAKPLATGKIYVPASFKTGPGQNDWIRGVFAVDPETAAYDKVCEYFWYVRLSRDGRMMALSQGGKEKDQRILTLDAKGEGTLRQLADFGGTTTWSPDGKQILVAKDFSKPEDAAASFRNWRVDIDGSDVTQLPIPETDEVCDWSPDGQWLVTMSDRHPPHGRGYQLYLMRPDGSEPRRLTRDKGLNGLARFSPDSRRIAYGHMDPDGTEKMSLWVVNVDGSDRRRVIEEPLESGNAPEEWCWSPDGKSLAYRFGSWRRRPQHDTQVGATASLDLRLAIIDVEGKNRRVLDLPPAYALEGPDWR